MEAYHDLGILPAAMRNYLLRLGWSHGDDEIISTEQAIEWFDLSSVGRSPARFDMEKLTSLNGHYIRETDDGDLVDGVLPIIEKLLRGPVTEAAKTRLKSGSSSRKALRSQRLQRPISMSSLARFRAACAPSRSPLASRASARASWLPG